jgi:hypothetical protein
MGQTMQTNIPYQTLKLRREEDDVKLCTIQNIQVNNSTTQKVLSCGLIWIHMSSKPAAIYDLHPTPKENSVWHQTNAITNPPLSVNEMAMKENISCKRAKAKVNRTLKYLWPVYV